MDFEDFKGRFVLSAVRGVLACSAVRGLVLGSLAAVCTSSLSLAAPPNTVGVLLNDPGSSPGYTLFGALSGYHTYLVNNQGELIQRWTSAYTAGNAAYLLPDGHLLRSAYTGGSYFLVGGSGGRVEEYDWEGNLVWALDYSDAQKRQHHDAIKLPNGNVLLIAFEAKTSAEAIAAGRDPSLLTHATGELWPDTLIEVEPTGALGGTVVWEWHVWDHLIQDFDATKANHGVVGDHPELVDLNFVRDGGADWLHFNGLDYNAALDQIVVSTPYLNEIWIIDHSTTTAESASHAGGDSGRGGDLLYRWGNPAAYRAGTATDQTLFFQHNPQWIAPGLPGENRLLVFNNGRNRPGGNASSVDEIITPVDGSGAYPLPVSGIYDPASAVWSYSAVPTTSFYAGFVSGAQRMPNGNTLICNGPAGAFFEVSSGGVEHWRYLNPAGPLGPVDQGAAPSANGVFRATRYAADYAGLVGRALVPQGTVELTPWDPFQVIAVSANGGEMFVRWNSAPDESYEIQYRADLEVGPWSPIATVVAIGTEAVYSDTDAGRLSGGAGYYRVVLVP